MLLDVQTSRVASNFSSRTDDAMARNNEGKGVPPARMTHSPRRSMLSDGGGNLGVCARFPEGDFAQGCPHLLLERRPESGVQGQGGQGSCPFKVMEHRIPGSAEERVFRRVLEPAYRNESCGEFLGKAFVRSH
jgi:hypothetical protein